MAENTAIEWTDATFNPWHGCARVSPACAHCYADALSVRYGRPDLWNEGGKRMWISDATWAKPRAWNRERERLNDPWLVFCASMADVFEDHPDVEPHRQRLWALIEETPWLTWQLLTKRPENIAKMLPWPSAPENVWLGTSVENSRFTWRAQAVQEVAAPVHFLSCEPLLGSLFESRGKRDPLDLSGIEWVIGGGESGPGHRPFEPTWARDLRDECSGRGIPFFWKQNGGPTPKSRGKLLGGREWCERPNPYSPADMRLFA